MAIAAGGLIFQNAPDWGHGLPLVSPPLADATAEIEGDYTVAILAGVPFGYLKESMVGDPTLLNVNGFLVGTFLIDGAIGDELTDELESAVETGSLFAIADPNAEADMPFVDGGSLADCVEIPARERLLKFCAVELP